MNHALIVSSSVPGVAVRLTEDESGRSVRLEKASTGFPISVYNFQVPPAGLSEEMTSMWIWNNQQNLGHLLRKMRNLGLSSTTVYSVLHAVYDEGDVEWVAEEDL